MKLRKITQSLFGGCVLVEDVKTSEPIYVLGVSSSGVVRSNHDGFYIYWDHSERSGTRKSFTELYNDWCEIYNFYTLK